MKKQIKVSCGILQKENKYLLVQRPAKSANGLKWEFPGGKLEKNETAANCLIRELEEELDIIVKPSKQLETVIREESDFIIELIPFLCHIIQGEITLLEHLDMQWIDIKTSCHLDICLGDQVIIDQLKNN